MTPNTHRRLVKMAVLALALLAPVTAATATPTLTGVSTDPGIVAAGDTVDIVTKLHESAVWDGSWDDREVRITLHPGNRLTREHVTIVQDRDDTVGILEPDQRWNERFRVDIDGDAPTGEYGFELHITYLENGEPVTLPGGGETRFIEKFTIPVDADGVGLHAEVVGTEPRRIRPGNDAATATVRITNTGSRPVEEIDLSPVTPDGIDPAYSADTSYYINRLDPGSGTTVDVGLDLAEDLPAGLHTVMVEAAYEDVDSTDYTSRLDVPVRVEGRPDLEAVNHTRTALEAGGTTELRVTVRNTGEHDAEGVTARLIAERTQPFAIEDRSDYLGEIPAGGTAEAVLRIDADRDAVQKEHRLQLQMQASGDREEGDSSTYTFRDTVAVTVAGRTTSPLIYGGVGAALLVSLVTAYHIRRGGETDGDDTDR